MKKARTTIFVVYLRVFSHVQSCTLLQFIWAQSWVKGAALDLDEQYASGVPASYTKTEKCASLDTLTLTLLSCRKFLNIKY